MTQYPPPPPPPPYGPGQPGGFGGYPPPGYPAPYGYPPAWPPPIAAPTAAPAVKPKTRSARIFDALTIVFEIGIVLIVLIFVLARISQNETHNWVNRGEQARALQSAARLSERAQLARAAETLRAAQGAVTTETLQLSPEALVVTLESILDEQAALEKSGDDSTKAALKTAGAELGLKQAEPHYHDVVAALAQGLNGEAPPPATAVAMLLAHSRAPLQRLSALSGSAALWLDHIPAVDPADGRFQARRLALEHLIVLLCARDREQAAATAGAPEPRTVDAALQANDPRLPMALTLIHAHSFLPPGMEHQPTATATLRTLLTACVRGINHRSTRTGRSGQPRGDSGLAGTLAAGLETGLPTAADIGDRVIGRLLIDHLAHWRTGVKTDLWPASVELKTASWTGDHDIESTCIALLALSENLRTIAGRPVGAVVRIRNCDGSVESLTVAAWLARLQLNAQAADNTSAAGLPDGPLHVGTFNLALCVHELDRTLRIARAQLHLLQVNARLHEEYAATQMIPAALADHPVDPITGRPYVYQPYEDDWNLFSDFGPADPAATPNQPDDPQKDLKANLRQGLVMR